MMYGGSWEDSSNFQFSPNVFLEFGIVCRSLGLCDCRVIVLVGKLSTGVGSGVSESWNVSSSILSANSSSSNSGELSGEVCGSGGMALGLVLFPIPLSLGELSGKIDGSLVSVFSRDCIIFTILLTAKLILMKY